MTQKSSQFTPEGCDTPIFFGAVQFCGWVGSLLVENCGVH
jgi:hypothetical protein